mgnify:CR=1 FL=1
MNASVPESFDLHEALTDLFDAWCERRDARCLRALLSAWPMSSGLSDERHELWRALRHIRAMEKDRLPPEELGVLRRCTNALERTLDD